MFVALCIALCGTGAAFCFVILSRGPIPDFIGHWRMCKYTLMGIDPFPLIGAAPAIEEVGEIPRGFSNAPWSLLLGGILYGVMLPLDAARIYVTLLHFAALAALSVVVYRKRDVWGLERFDVIAGMLLVMVHFSFMYSISCGNSGAILCIFLMISILVVDDHPWIAGVLVAFAMTKPQIAVPICGVMVLNRKFRTIALAAVISLVSWAGASALTGTAPLELLAEMGRYGVMSDKQYLGLLSPLRFFGASPSVILVANVAIGVTFTVVLWWLIKRSACRFGIVMGYVPACAASVFWIYKNGTDFLILSICAFFFCLLFLHEERTPVRLAVALAGMLFMEASRFLVAYVSYTYRTDYLLMDASKGIEGLFVLLLTGYLVLRWIKTTSPPATPRVTPAQHGV